jgi:hypothetical protein
MSPGERKWVRGGPLPGGAFDVLLIERGARFIVAASVQSESSVGYPLHLFSADGKLIRSFGTDDPRYDPTNAEDVIRLLTPSGNDGFWAARYTRRYEVERYDNRGDRTGLFRRTVNWFPTLDHAPKPYSHDVPPSPYVMAVREQADGLLWIAIAVPAANWADGLSKPIRGEGGGTRVEIEDIRKFFDTVIEVIDPARGVIVSERVDHLVKEFLPGNRVVSVANSPDGVPYLEIRTAVLVDRPGRRE